MSGQQGWDDVESLFPFKGKWVFYFNRNTTSSGYHSSFFWSEKRRNAPPVE